MKGGIQTSLTGFLAGALALSAACSGLDAPTTDSGPYTASEFSPYEDELTTIRRWAFDDLPFHEVCDFAQKVDPSDPRAVYAYASIVDSLADGVRAVKRDSADVTGPAVEATREFFQWVGAAALIPVEVTTVEPNESPSNLGLQWRAAVRYREGITETNDLMNRARQLIQNMPDNEILLRASSLERRCAPICEICNSDNVLSLTDYFMSGGE